MPTRSTLSMALALLCVLSIGVSATTLESSMKTDPDDVINLDWEEVPIGEDTAAEMKQEIQDNGNLEGSGDSGEEGVESRTQGDDRGQQSQPDSGSQDERGAEGQQPQMGSNAQQNGLGIPDPLPWDLRWILAAVGIVAAIVALGYWLARRVGSPARSTGGGAEPSPWPPAGPTTEVDRAWISMVRHLDIDRPWTRTPAELAAAAIDAGLDPEGVEVMTAAFAEVRYGGSPVTDAHRERARTALRQLNLAPEGGPG